MSDAKRYFSKTNCPAYAIGVDYLTGSAIRQDYLETALLWIAKSDMNKYNGNIESYMAVHQKAPNALALWLYFQSVIPWSQGGKTTDDNLQMLCKPCNRTKSDD